MGGSGVARRGTPREGRRAIREGRDDGGDRRGVGGPARPSGHSDGGGPDGAGSPDEPFRRSSLPVFGGREQRSQEPVGRRELAGEEQLDPRDRAAADGHG